MRRLFACALLTALVALPALQLRCAMACAQHDVGDSAEACGHQDQLSATSAPLVAITTHHDCEQHAAPDTAIASDRPLKLDGVPVLSIVGVIPVVSFSSLRSEIAWVSAPSAGPPGVLAIPLRV